MQGQLSPARDQLIEYVRELSTKLNNGEEVVIPENLKTVGTAVFVIFLGFFTARVLKSFLRFLLGTDDDDQTSGAGSSKGPATRLSIKFNDSVYTLKFTKDDFRNEEKPAKGLSVLSLKFAVSRELTPKILESRNKAAATATSIINPSKFTLIYDGQKLDDDTKYLTEYGIKNGAEIVVLFASPNQSQDVEQIDDEEEEEEEGESDSNTRRKRVRNRNSKKNKKNKKGLNKKKGKQSKTPEIDESKPTEFPAPAVTPLTPAEEIQKVLDELDSDILPLITEFIENTPKQADAREEEHHRISELVLLKMFMMDGIDASADPEVRQMRKDAINKMHKHLSSIDKANKAAA